MLLSQSVSSIGTSDNWKGQCLINTADGGRISDLSISKYDFSGFATRGRALSHWKITLSCLCSYSDRFLSMLVLDELIIADICILWGFSSVWAIHNKLHLVDPSKCREETWNHVYLVLHTTFLYGWAYHTILFLASYSTMQK